MTIRIGLGVGSGAVRSVVLNGERIVWRGERPVPDHGSIGEAIATLLGQCGVAVRGQPAIVALGPATVRVKRLSGLPPLADASVATQVLRANARRFFLDAAAPVTSVAWHNGDAWWGAAFDSRVVADVERACAEAGVRLEACVPSVAAVASLCPNGTVWMRDGDVTASIAIDAGNWRPAPNGNSGSLVDAIPTLSILGDAADRMADAFAAGRCAARPPLALRTPNTRAERIARDVRRASLVTACIVAAAAALFGKGVAANMQLARDQRRVDELHATTQQWMPLARSLRDASQALDRIAAARRDRRSVVQLLSAITRALPESTAILAFHADSAGGSMTFVSHSASTAIARLSSVDAIEGTRVSGPVTRENVGTAELQRVSVRFRLARPTTPATKAK